MLFTLLLPAVASPPTWWADPVERFPGGDRIRAVLVNPTTARAVLSLDGVPLAEVPPRGEIVLTLPSGSYPVRWRLPEGTVRERPSLVLNR